MLSPFNSDENYKNFRENLIQCKFKYILSNIYQIFETKIGQEFQNEENILLYIDGIDDEFCFYLANERSVLFKKL